MKVTNSVQHKERTAVSWPSFSVRTGKTKRKKTLGPFCFALDLSLFKSNQQIRTECLRCERKHVEHHERCKKKKKDNLRLQLTHMFLKEWSLPVCKFKWKVLEKCLGLGDYYFTFYYSVLTVNVLRLQQIWVYWISFLAIKVFLFLLLVQAIIILPMRWKKSFSNFHYE